MLVMQSKVTHKWNLSTGFEQSRHGANEENDEKRLQEQNRREAGNIDQHEERDLQWGKRSQVLYVLRAGNDANGNILNQRFVSVKKKKMTRDPV